MIISITRRLCLLALIAASIPVTLASPPSGVIQFKFDTPNVSVWDLTGGYQFDQEILGVAGENIPLSFAIGLSQDARGFLRTSDTTMLSIGNDIVAGQYLATGKVSGGGFGTTRVSLVVKFNGRDIIAGRDTTFTINITYNLTISANGEMSGTARGSARFSKLGTGTIKSSVTVPLPPGMDGSWGLQLNLLPLNRVSGSGLIVLSNGRTLSANASGSYNSRTDKSKVQVTCINENRGSSVNVGFEDGGGVINSVSGNILGQTVKQ